MIENIFSGGQCDDSALAGLVDFRLDWFVSREPGLELCYQLA
jgi:hypothetical protein